MATMQSQNGPKAKKSVGSTILRCERLEDRTVLNADLNLPIEAVEPPEDAFSCEKALFAEPEVIVCFGPVDEYIEEEYTEEEYTEEEYTEEEFVDGEYVKGEIFTFGEGDTGDGEDYTRPFEIMPYYRTLTGAPVDGEETGVPTDEELMFYTGVVGEGGEEEYVGDGNVLIDPIDYYPLENQYDGEINPEIYYTMGPPVSVNEGAGAPALMANVEADAGPTLLNGFVFIGPASSTNATEEGAESASEDIEFVSAEIGDTAAVDRDDRADDRLARTSGGEQDVESDENADTADADGELTPEELALLLELATVEA